MNIRIERVEVFGVVMPLVGAFASAKGPKAAQKSAVVRITGTGGVVGIGSVSKMLGIMWLKAHYNMQLDARADGCLKY